MSQIQRPKRPRAISLISAWFLLSGGLSWLGSIASTLLGQWLQTKAMASTDFDASPVGMWLLGKLMFIAGIAGILPSTMAIASGFGLRKMKKWGYICSYLTMILYTFIQLFIWYWFVKSPPIAINLITVTSVSTSIAIAIGLIKNKIPI
jgi:uncharacterized membrane protein